MGHPVEDELFRVALSSGREELDGFADNGETRVPWGEVFGGVIGPMFEENDVKREGYEGDEEEEEGEVKMPHFECLLLS